MASVKHPAVAPNPKDVLLIGPAQLVAEMKELYCEDDVPWVIGYSGGKDSTAVLSLVWRAVAEIPEAQRTKPIHVISTDTLVENPIVSAWVSHSLVAMEEAAAAQHLPIRPHRLTPEISNTFWVNLIGKGYPAPRPKFRWCTERLKIKPSNRFIQLMVEQRGEVIVVLGTRKTESAARHRAMTQHESNRARDRMSPNGALPNSLIYSPIEAWTSDQVWTFLMQFPNPWGYDNKALLGMYQGASADGECPLVVDSSTPSCGDSRFGCWVCTLVEKDKSMQAMIQNDAEKEWMLPLLELRNALDIADDRPLRDFRRMNGSVQVFHGRPIPGPYTQAARADWLHRLLSAEKYVREHGPQEFRDIRLVSPAELEEIRRIWVVDKHEIEDLLPGIFEGVYGVPYVGRELDEAGAFPADALEVLRELCGEDQIKYQTLREMLEIEHRQRTRSRRQGLFDSLMASLKRGAFASQEEAMQHFSADSPEGLAVAESKVTP
jgi:DNA sulfur modification protein DndC